MTRKGAIRNLTIAAMAGASSLAVSAPAWAQVDDRYIGQMMQVGFNFCPAGWASAEGQIVAIAQNTALFSLLGTTYGGNGQTTFALPDLRGRMAINQGSGAGLSPYSLGQTGGSETTTLLSSNLPRHDHRGGILAVNAASNSTSANGNALAYSANNSYLSGADPDKTMDITMVQVANTGNSLPVTNRPPYLAMRWCIAVNGVFPARN